MVTCSGGCGLLTLGSAMRRVLSRVRRVGVSTVRRARLRSLPLARSGGAVASVPSRLVPRVRGFCTPPMGAPRSDADESESAYEFLDPNNPPELSEELISRLSEEGWSRVKPRYPDDFKQMFDKLALDGTPDYSQFDDLSKAFSATEAVPRVSEGPDRPTKPELNQCLLCKHYQRKMCDHLDRVEYTNINLLSKFINTRGFVNSRRINGTCGKGQRRVAKLVRRARNAGLMAYLENWKPSMSFMQQMNWHETEVEVDPREYKSTRSDKKKE